MSTYRNNLIERAQKIESETDEPEVLDYLQFRNHQCLNAWRVRRAEYAQSAAHIRPIEETGRSAS